MHIPHGFHVFLLAVLQLSLQDTQFRIKHFNLNIQRGEVFTDGIYGTTLIGNLRIEHHQVLQPLLDIPLIGTQFLLLLLDLLLNLLTLTLQTLHGDRLGGGFLLSRSRLLDRFLLGDNSGLRLPSLGRTLLGIRTQSKEHQ